MRVLSYGGAPVWRRRSAVSGAMALLTAFLTLAVYGLTMARTITWRNGGADGGELAAAAWVGGVAHPPGYPLYLTLVRVFQLVPVGDVAFRATLFSVLCAAVAAVLTSRTVVLLLGGGRAGG